MTLSTTSVAALAVLALTAVASTLPSEEPSSRAKIVRVGAGTFRSVTSVRSGAERVRVDEEVVLDRDDHLVRAWVRLEEPGHEPTSMWLDRATSTVVVARGAEVVRSQAPADAPWVYAPPETAAHAAVATPLGAWVVARAAPAGMLRIVHPERTELVPADQVLVTTEQGAVALVGDDPVDLDGRFAATVHLRRLGATLARVEEAPDRWVFADVLPRTAYF